jgi:hypothetical protein
MLALLRLARRVGNAGCAVAHVLLRASLFEGPCSPDERSEIRDPCNGKGRPAFRCAHAGYEAYIRSAATGVICFSASETERAASNSFGKISSTRSATRRVTGKPARMKSSLSIWSNS